MSFRLKINRANSYPKRKRLCVFQQAGSSAAPLRKSFCHEPFQLPERRGAWSGRRLKIVRSLFFGLSRGGQQLFTMPRFELLGRRNGTQRLAVRAFDLPPGVLRPRSHPRLADTANHSDVLWQIERRLWHGTACSACGSKLDRMRSQRRDEFRKRELRPQSSRRFPSFCSTLPSDRRPLRPLGRTDSITGKVSQTGTAWLTGSNRTARTTDTTCRLPLLPVRLSQSDLPAETD